MPSGHMTSPCVMTVPNFLLNVSDDLAVPRYRPRLSLNMSIPFVLLSGNFCLLCNKCYEDDEADGRMIECGRCHHRVHAKCEKLTGQYLFASVYAQRWLRCAVLVRGCQIRNICVCECVCRWTGAFLTCLNCLSDDLYELLSKLPESVAYTCSKCAERHPAEWRTALERQLQGCVHHVLTALLNSRTSSHLLRYKQVGCQYC